MKKPYSYCLLRYRHDPLTEEFATVGVIVSSPKEGFVGFKASKRFARIKAFFGKNVRLSDLKRALNRCSLLFDEISSELSSGCFLYGDLKTARDFGECIIPRDDSALRWSPVGGGYSANLEVALEQLYDRYIGRFETPEIRASRDDKQIWDQSLGRIFSREQVMPYISDVEIKAPLDSYHFNHAWKNGVWHLFEAISFDLLESDSIQSKALKWYGRTTQLKRSSERFELNLILGKPQDTSMKKSYDRALAILSANDVAGTRIIEEDQVEDFSRTYVERIKAHA